VAPWSAGAAPSHDASQPAAAMATAQAMTGQARVTAPVYPVAHTVAAIDSRLSLT